MPHHPAFIGIWDDEASDYRLLEPHERICTARWASTGHTQAAGELCAGPADDQIGDMWVCQHHYERAETWVIEAARTQVAEIRAAQDELATAQDELARRRRHFEAELDRREQARRERQLQLQRAQSVIYFVRRGDGLIKIGTSRVPKQRIAVLAVEHGPLEPLRTCPGSYDVEKTWHQRFARHRVEGEWFRPARELR